MRIESHYIIETEIYYIKVEVSNIQKIHELEPKYTNTTRKHIFYEGNIRCKFVVNGVLRRINLEIRFAVKRPS